jgi:hypothetical protein
MDVGWGLNLGRSSAAFAGRPHRSTRIMADLILHDEHGGRLIARINGALQQVDEGKREEKSRSGALALPGVWDPSGGICYARNNSTEPSRSTDKAIYMNAGLMSGTDPGMRRASVCTATPCGLARRTQDREDRCGRCV